jgi:hypothetical protein
VVAQAEQVVAVAVGRRQVPARQAPKASQVVQVVSRSKSIRF